MGIQTELNTIFSPESPFIESCEAMRIRFDYFSKPWCLTEFLRYIGAWFEEIVQAHASNGSFRVYYNRLPNDVELQRIDVDAVAEALNTTIEGVSSSDSYIYPSLIELFDRAEGEMAPVAQLFISRFYICIWLEHILLNEKVEVFVKKMCEIIEEISRPNVVSLVDLQLKTNSSILYTYEAFKAEFGALNLIVDKAPLKNYVRLYQFAEANTEVTVSNIVRHLDVNIDEGQEAEWNHELVCVSRYDFDLSAEENCFTIFKELISEINRKGKLCARL